MLLVFMLIISHLSSVTNGEVSCKTEFESNNKAPEAVDEAPEGDDEAPAEDDKTAVEGDNVTYSCSTTHNGAHNASLVWSDKQGRQVSQTTVPTKGDLSSTYKSVAYVPKIPTLKCYLFEWIPGKGWAITNKTCETEEQDILYSVRSINIWPFPYASPGEELTCSAQGNPDPEYSWFKKEDGGEWVRADEDDNDEDNEDKDNDKITAELSDNSTSAIYKCVAMNTIRKQPYIIESLGVEVTVGGATKRWIIVGVVLGVIALIAIIGGIVYFVAM